MLSLIPLTLCVANSKSSGRDYQAQWWRFLAELKAKYPKMFTENMISTGKPIDDSVKLKQWKAKYFNGTNVLDRGVGYVLAMKQLVNISLSLKKGNSFLFN